MNCLFHSCRNCETCQALQRSLHPSCRLTNFTRAKVRCKFRRLRSVTENLDAVQDIWPAECASSRIFFKFNDSSSRLKLTSRFFTKDFLLKCATLW